MTGTLRVTPEQLITTSGSFDSSAQQVQTLTSQMIATIDALNSTWAGEAATAYYNKAHSLQTSIDRMVRMIREHSADLAEMARVYQEAERASEENAAALQTDVII